MGGERNERGGREQCERVQEHYIIPDLIRASLAGPLSLSLSLFNSVSFLLPPPSPLLATTFFFFPLLFLLYLSPRLSPFHLSPRGHTPCLSVCLSVCVCAHYTLNASAVFIIY